MTYDSHVGHICHYTTAHSMSPLVILRIQDIHYKKWRIVWNQLCYSLLCYSFSNWNDGSCDMIGESYSILASSSAYSCELSCQLIYSPNLLILHPSLAVIWWKFHIHFHLTNSGNFSLRTNVCHWIDIKKLSLPVSIFSIITFLLLSLTPPRKLRFFLTPRLVLFNKRRDSIWSSRFFWHWYLLFCLDMPELIPAFLCCCLRNEGLAIWEWNLFSQTKYETWFIYSS